MSDIDNKPTLGRKPLGLKRSVEAGEVKQTFSHGRTNKVVVEVKRRKFVKPGSAPEAPAPAAPAPAPAPAPVQRQEPPKAPAAPQSRETAKERTERLQREAEEERLRLAEQASRREEEQR